jgi:hypothetical protein
MKDETLEMLKQDESILGIKGNKVIQYVDGRKKVYTINEEPSMTDQQYKEDTDVNNIIEKFRKTGQIMHVAQIQGKFADVADIQSLQESMVLVSKAQEHFAQLPGETRSQFGNSVINMVKFLADPANDEKAVKMGLKVKIKHQTPDQGLGGQDANPSPSEGTVQPAAGDSAPSGSDSASS